MKMHVKRGRDANTKSSQNLYFFFTSSTSQLMISDVKRHAPTAKYPYENTSFIQRKDTHTVTMGQMYRRSSVSMDCCECSTFQGRTQTRKLAASACLLWRVLRIHSQCACATTEPRYSVSQPLLQENSPLGKLVSGPHSRRGDKTPPASPPSKRGGARYTQEKHRGREEERETKGHNRIEIHFEAPKNVPIGLGDWYDDSMIADDQPS